jgi:formylglycine-generating enzyme required for sulfatase activity
MKVNACSLGFLLAFLALSMVSCASAPTPNGPIGAIKTGIDPEAWARVPVGEFLQGQHNHPVMVDYDYEIMLTDVTVAQYAAYLNLVPTQGSVELLESQLIGYYPGDEFHGFRHEEEIVAGDYIHLPLDDPGLRLRTETTGFTPQPGYENHPITLFSWFGARAYCQFYGWQLPSEIEWEKAARGEDGRTYPWGDEIGTENANYYSSHDIFEKLLGKGGDTTPVGFYNGKHYQIPPYGETQTQDSASPYGLYDMAGNVWQWTDDVYPDQHYRYMRGGSKDTYAYNLRLWTRNSAGPSY